MSLELRFGSPAHVGATPFGDSLGHLAATKPHFDAANTLNFWLDNLVNF